MNKTGKKYTKILKYALKNNELLFRARIFWLNISQRVRNIAIQAGKSPIEITWRRHFAE